MKIFKDVFRIMIPDQDQKRLEKFVTGGEPVAIRKKRGRIEAGRVDGDLAPGRTRSTRHGWN